MHPALPVAKRPGDLGVAALVKIPRDHDELVTIVPCRAAPSAQQHSAPRRCGSCGGSRSSRCPPFRRLANSSATSVYERTGPRPGRWRIRPACAVSGTAQGRPAGGPGGLRGGREEAQPPGRVTGTCAAGHVTETEARRGALSWSGTCPAEGCELPVVARRVPISKPAGPTTSTTKLPSGTRVKRVTAYGRPRAPSGSARVGAPEPARPPAKTPTKRAARRPAGAGSAAAAGGAPPRPRPAAQPRRPAEGHPRAAGGRSQGHDEVYPGIY